MLNTPSSLRLHIGIFGRRNVGKSTLLNALTGQDVSIVSSEPGTTTDPVEKPMELLPLGPVLFIDTAGIDDVGALGEERIKRSRRVLDRTDLALLVSEVNRWGDFEERLIAELEGRGIPFIVVLNKADLVKGSKEDLLRSLNNIKDGKKLVLISARNKEGIDSLKQLIIEAAPPEYFESRPIVSDLVPPGELIVLVVPIDLEAPKGRIILPQVQTIRDILDADSYCIVVKESRLKSALSRLNKPPKLVVTDSQAFAQVAADVPEDIPLTSFSILFARFKGDLEEFVRGIRAIDTLKNGDKVLIAETCTHHPIGDDIGRVKIPRWIREYTGCDVVFEYTTGKDFPDSVAGYKLVIHCGGCMVNRKEVLSRIYKCRKDKVPITNYGITIAYSLGIIRRALQPFPSAGAILEEQRGNIF